MDAAYIGGRYQLNYRMLRRDLDILEPDVKRLLDLTETACKAHIEDLKSRDL